MFWLQGIIALQYIMIYETFLAFNYYYCLCIGKQYDEDISCDGCLQPISHNMPRKLRT